MKSIATFLMFVGEQAGKAEEAITFYTSLFRNSKIISIERYGADGNEPEGSVKVAKFTLNGVEHMAIDSHIEHQFTFTPAMSLFVECESMEELEKLHQALSDHGSELMPLDDYGFSKQFSWVSDRYGVSWQLNLA
ncbi:MAG: VOC family protein [Cyanobacteria bacterium P01_D01_bin.1]